MTRPGRAYLVRINRIDSSGMWQIRIIKPSGKVRAFLGQSLWDAKRVLRQCYRSHWKGY